MLLHDITTLTSNEMTEEAFLIFFPLKFCCCVTTYQNIRVMYFPLSFHIKQILATKHDLFPTVIYKSTCNILIKLIRKFRFLNLHNS